MTRWKVNRKTEKQKRTLPWRKIRRWTLWFVLIGLIAGPYLMVNKASLPDGVDTQSPLLPAGEGTRVLFDTTAWNPATSNRVIRQEIFDTMLERIEQADSLIVLDFFLWNPWQGALKEEHRALARELANALIEKKTQHPECTILALTDPINALYGDDAPAFYQELNDADISVVFTDLNRLHDSNHIYAGPARFYGPLISRIPGLTAWMNTPRISNPFDPEGKAISLLQAGRLLLFKANHRKVLITDDSNGELHLLVTSFNPANGSSAHSNIGLLTKGPVAVHALKSELACMAWSTENANEHLTADFTNRLAELSASFTNEPDIVSGDEVEGPEIQWLTEDAIRQQILTMLDTAHKGDIARISMFYLSERSVIQSLKSAALNGVEIRLILDPNKDAFGRVKNGIPNRPVAAELIRFSDYNSGKIAIRWAATHGEQFHTKAMSISNPGTGKFQLMAGSANWTRRNLCNLNLEACLYIQSAPDTVNQYNAMFDRAWIDSGDLVYTVHADTYIETGWKKFWKGIVYRIQESTGMSTF